MTVMKGWIALHRKIREHWIWQDEKYFKRWCDLLMLAAWEPTLAVFAKEKVQLKRGQLVTSVRTLMHRWETNNKYVSRFFTLLEEDGMIQCLRYTKYSVVTIVHFDQYQMETATTVEDEFPIQNNALSEQVRLQERQHERLPNKQDKINNNKTNNSSSSSREEKLFFFVDKFKADTKVLERAAENLGCSQQKILEMLKLYSNEMIITDEDAENYTAFKKHFFNWARKHLEIQNSKNNGNGKQKPKSKQTGGGQNDDRFSPRRGTDPGSHESHDFEGKF